jgi:hypothetical protein
MFHFEVNFPRMHPVQWTIRMNGSDEGHEQAAGDSMKQKEQEEKKKNAKEAKLQCEKLRYPVSAW